MILFSWPPFEIASSGQLSSIFAVQICFTVLMSIFLGPIPAALVEMFPARMRYSAMGTGFNLSVCIFGGTAPLVATWLVMHYGSIFAPAIYLTFLAVASFLAALSYTEGSRTDI
jgi:MHS family proline/betaine transporter-like MFS transporter